MARESACWFFASGAAFEVEERIFVELGSGFREVGSRCDFRSGEGVLGFCDAKSDAGVFADVRENC